MSYFVINNGIGYSKKGSIDKKKRGSEDLHAKLMVPGCSTVYMSINVQKHYFLEQILAHTDTTELSDHIPTLIIEAWHSTFDPSLLHSKITRRDWYILFKCG